MTSSPQPRRTAVHPWVREGGEGRVRFGIAYGPRGDWRTLGNFAQEVESLGFDSYWAMDHPLSGFDCWTDLAAAAVATKRIRLGSLASCIYYRSPVMLARLAADVDRLSDGRLILGIGIGNHRKEFSRMGLRFPNPSERLEALEETVQIVEGLWGDGPFTHVGKHYKLDDGANVRPGPVQRPYVPILIAGGGERVTLRQVAQYADMSNFSAHDWAGRAFGPEDVRRKFEALRSHCSSLGRNYDSVVRSHAAVPVVVAETQKELRTKLDEIPPHIRDAYKSSTIAGLPDDVIAQYQPLIDAGVTYCISGLYGNDAETLRLLAQRVVPRLRYQTGKMPTTSSTNAPSDIAGETERWA